MKNHLFAFLLTFGAIFIFAIITYLTGDFSMQKLTFVIASYVLYQEFYRDIKTKKR